MVGPSADAEAFDFRINIDRHRRENVVPGFVNRLTAALSEQPGEFRIALTQQLRDVVAIEGGHGRQEAVDERVFRRLLDTVTIQVIAHRLRRVGRGAETRLSEADRCTDLSVRSRGGCSNRPGSWSFSDPTTRPLSVAGTRV